MPLSYKNDEKQDERLDPYSDNAHQLHQQEQDAYDREFNDITNNYDATADDKQENANVAKKNTKNIEDTKEKEAETGNWKNNFGSTGGDKQKFSMKTFFKKKGPMGLIIGLLLGGGGGLTLLFSPGIAIVQLKEAMLGDLNDQVGAMNLRTDHLLRTKLKTLQAGFSICSNSVSVRCKFSTMSKRQVAKFQKAGFTIEPAEADKRFGRTKVTSMTFPSNAEGKPGVTVTNPSELRNHLLGNPSARSAMRKAFNPKFVGLSDAISSKVFARFKSDKTQKVTGDTDEERDKSVTRATAGQAAGVGTKGYRTDSDGRNYVYDANGAKVYESGDGSDADAFKEIAERNQASLAGIAEKAQASKPGAKAVGSVLKSGLKGASVLGALDTACTVYNISRAVAAAAKATRALQLFQFAMIFFNTADRIKSGDATPDEVTYLGNNITTVDTNKMIVDEDSTWEGSDPDTAVAKEHPNPYYGANGLDSAGYKVAAYNEAPNLTSRDLQYTVGGGLSGRLSSVMDSVADTLGGRENIRKTCKTVQSWWARTAGLIAGVVSAIGTFGVSTVVSIGASAAVGFAMPFLEAALADIIAGTVVGADTKGVDAGDAVFSGGGVLFGSMAMGHGMTPANRAGLKQYLAINNEVKADYIATETYEAKNTPFDANNQYSFLGSAVRKINPAVVKSTASTSGALTNIPSILSTAFSGIIPHTSAYQNFNDERFSKCNDEAYTELGIDADIFCNVRYMMTPEQLALDSDEAAQWMITNEHIEEDGMPKSDDYKDWIKYCTEREDGWGETSNDDPGDNIDKETGKICVEKNDKIKYFPVFFIDKSLSDSMDEDTSATGETAFVDPDSSTATAVSTTSSTSQSTTTEAKSMPPQQRLHSLPPPISLLAMQHTHLKELTRVSYITNKLAEVDIRLTRHPAYTIS